MWRPAVVAMIAAAAYAAICLTPAKREVVRLAPDFGRFFYPPFFLYSEVFASEKVGPFSIGASENSFLRSAQEAFGTIPTHEACSEFSNVRERLFKPTEMCLRARSRFGLAPLFWVVRIEEGRVTRIDVFTEATAEL